MRGSLLGITILSFSHFLLFLWRYELLPFSVVWCIVLICLGSIILIISEILWQDVTNFFGLITASHRYALSFIILIAILANLTFVGPGYIHADGISHSFKVWYLRESWLKGNFYPLWCPYWYSGYPFLEFYGPFFYVFAAVLSLSSNWMIGSKLAIYLAGIMSSLAMYGLIYVVTQDKSGSIVGAIAYTLTYYRFPLLTKYGHLASSLVLLFIPLLFLFLELAIKKEKQVFAMFAGLCWAGVLLSHQGAGYMAFLLVLFYLIMSCAIKFNLKNITFIGSVGLISIGVALGISSFFIVPYFINGTEANTGILDPHWLGYPLSLPLILTRDFIHVNQPFPVYVGNSILILAFIAVILRRNRASIIYTASLVFSFFFVLGSELSFYTRIPLITSLEFPYRFLLLVCFVASVLSGITVASLKDIQKPISGYLREFMSNPILKKRIIVLLIVIMIIDLWPGTLISKNRPQEWLIDDDWMKTYDWLNQQPGPYKTLRFGNPGPSYVVFASVVGDAPVLYGYFRQSANKDYLEFLTLFTEEIKSLENTPQRGLLNPLKLLGVKYVPLDNTLSYAQYLHESSQLEVVQTFGNVSVLEFSEYTSPIIVSQNAEILSGDNEIESFYKHVTDPNYDPSKMIFLKENQLNNAKELPLQSPVDSIGSPDDFNYKILNLDVKESAIFARIYTSAPSFVFFSFSFFPGWKAFVDGNKSEILIAEPFFMCLYIDKGGTHTISLKYQLSTPKIIGSIITSFTLLIVFFVIFWSYRQAIREIIDQSAFRKYRGRK
ncbi:MAG: hypothetical protein KAI34_00280 [Candidatus Lokiarchaeota archaeon]|nr:hypothetical protein [Candidatus Lokiarchaeota archaeon]